MYFLIEDYSYFLVDVSTISGKNWVCKVVVSFVRFLQRVKKIVWGVYK